jgi:hypothetical protein
VTSVTQAVFAMVSASADSAIASGKKKTFLRVLLSVHHVPQIHLPKSVLKVRKVSQ